MRASSRDPRANQKQRTRAAIVEAATRLLRSGGSPSVAQAAEEAKVSRATAYRYFPTPEDLLLEVAAVTPAMAPVEAMLADLASGDAEERFLLLQDTFNPIVLAEEARMRTALRAYLDTWLTSRRKGENAPPVREGRRLRWLDKVLEPARGRMSKRQWQRLRSALALTLGMDAFIVMKDVCRLKDEEAQEVLRWAAQALLRAGLDDALGTGATRLQSSSPLSRAGGSRAAATARKRRLPAAGAIESAGFR